MGTPIYGTPMDPTWSSVSPPIPAWLRMRPMELHLGHCFRASKMAGTSGDASFASVSWRRKLGLASVGGLEDWGSQQELACFQGLSTFWGWISGISMKQKRFPCFFCFFFHVAVITCYNCSCLRVESPAPGGSFEWQLQGTHLCAQRGKHLAHLRWRWAQSDVLLMRF